MKIFYDTRVLNESLKLLEKGGRGRRECVVLWLGKRIGEDISIECAHMPAHEASSDYFYIYKESMDVLKKHIREKRLMVGAQVHTHPQEAFHSKADDDWAFIRHEGAISIVLPRFAKDITVENFMHRAAVYSLTDRNLWRKLGYQELCQTCILQN